MSSFKMHDWPNIFSYKKFYKQAFIMYIFNVCTKANLPWFTLKSWNSNSRETQNFRDLIQK